jgi:hypothetical protein
LPTTAIRDVTVFAGPPEAVEGSLVPAGVMAVTRYTNDAPGVITLLASTQAVDDVHESPAIGAVTNGLDDVVVPRVDHVVPLSALRSNRYPVTVSPPELTGAPHPSDTRSVPPVTVNAVGDVGAAAVPYGPADKLGAPSPMAVSAVTRNE